MFVLEAISSAIGEVCTSVTTKQHESEEGKVFLYERICPLISIFRLAIRTCLVASVRIRARQQQGTDSASGLTMKLDAPLWAMRIVASSIDNSTLFPFAFHSYAATVSVETDRMGQEFDLGLAY
jgi:hypothetical protein